MNPSVDGFICAGLSVAGAGQEQPEYDTYRKACGAKQEGVFLGISMTDPIAATTEFHRLIVSFRSVVSSMVISVMQALGCIIEICATTLPRPLHGFTTALR